MLSALKAKEIQAPATTWLNMYDIMLSETNKIQKNNYYVIPNKVTS